MRTRRVLGQTSRRRIARHGPTSSDIRRVLRDGGPHMVVQPILDVASGQVSGYEALARFGPPPTAEPHEWFAAAARCGLGPDLEAAAIANALRLRGDAPARTLLSVNVSPSVFGTPQLAAVLRGDLSGLTIEITEHELADDAAALLAAIDHLRARGARIAVDDVGQGYAGLKRVMGLRPDVLKLDREIVTGVAREPAKVAMLEAVVHFAARTGSQVCAEGIESVEDLATIADLDVGLAQGWAIGRPSTSFEPASVEAGRACSAARAGGLRVGLLPDRDLGGVLTSLAEAADVRTALARLMRAAPLLGCESVRVAEPTDCEFPTARLVLAERTIGHVLLGTARARTHERILLDSAAARSMLLVPLIAGGRPVGLLQCFSSDERPWPRSRLRAARILAAAFGPVLAALQHGC